MFLEIMFQNEQGFATFFHAGVEIFDEWNFPANEMFIKALLRGIYINVPENSSKNSLNLL